VPLSGEDLGDADYVEIMERVVLPVATEFAPELVLVSGRCRGPERLICDDSYQRSALLVCSISLLVC
jgi:hypothetical protein